MTTQAPVYLLAAKVGLSVLYRERPFVRSDKILKAQDTNYKKDESHDGGGLLH